MVTEPLARLHFILAGKAVVTTNYNRGGGGGLQPLKALLERASTPGRMIGCLGICLKLWETDVRVPASLQLSWVILAKPGAGFQWC